MDVLTWEWWWETPIYTLNRAQFEFAVISISMGVCSLLFLGWKCFCVVSQLRTLEIQHESLKHLWQDMDSNRDCLQKKLIKERRLRDASILAWKKIGVDLKQFSEANLCEKIKNAAEKLGLHHVHLREIRTFHTKGHWTAIPLREEVILLYDSQIKLDLRWHDVPAVVICDHITAGFGLLDEGAFGYTSVLSSRDKHFQIHVDIDFLKRKNISLSFGDIAAVVGEALSNILTTSSP